MSALYILVPLALLLATGAVAAFLWAVGQGEFEELEARSLRVVFDDDA